MKTWICEGIKATESIGSTRIEKDYEPIHKLCPAAVRIGVDLASGKTRFNRCTCECHA